MPPPLPDCPSRRSRRPSLNHRYIPTRSHLRPPVRILNSHSWETPVNPVHPAGQRATGKLVQIVNALYIHAAEAVFICALIFHLDTVIPYPPDPECQIQCPLPEGHIPFREGSLRPAGRTHRTAIPAIDLPSCPEWCSQRTLIVTVSLSRCDIVNMGEVIFVHRLDMGSVNDRAITRMTNRIANKSFFIFGSSLAWF